MSKYWNELLRHWRSGLAHSMSLCNREASVVRLSVCLSVGKLFRANRYYYHRNDWIATKLAHDGPQTGLHPGCAQDQGQGQRSRDRGTSVMSRNVCYTVGSRVLSLHALTLWNTIILSFQYKYQAARCLNIGMSYSVIDGLVCWNIAMKRSNVAQFQNRYTLGFGYGGYTGGLFWVLV